MQLDIRTVTLVGMATAMLFSILGVVVARGRHTCPGFAYWTSANLCASVALLTLGLDGILPWWFAIPVGNALGIAACTLTIHGVRRFRGQSGFWWPGLVAGVPTLAVICYYGFISPNLNLRIVLISAYLGSATLFAAIQFYSAIRPGYRLSLGFTASAMALFTVQQLIRVLYTAAQPPLTSYFSPSPVLAYLMLLTVLGIVAWSFGYFLINHDHMVEHLKEAQSRAARADSAKSQFLANASHEIRTPMNGVIGLTELLLDTPLDATQRDYVETVRDSGIALLEIINELLDLSKIEAGRLELAEAPFDPREVVEQTVHLLAWKAEGKGLKLRWDVDPDVPFTLLGDAGRLRQVLTNLVGNSIKFTGCGEVSIRVSFDNSLLRFSVTDTGPGIAKADQTRLFERFEQMHNGRQNGTGLGLAIFKELAHRMGGRIGVVSEPGQGSTFWFTAAPKQVLNDHDSPVLEPYAALNDLKM
jgi:signal transduction histidine kinase